MTDKRRPDFVVLLRNPTNKGSPATKVELFCADQFDWQRLRNSHGVPITASNVRQFMRLRVNGAWYPRRHGLLYTRKQVLKIFSEVIFNEVDKRTRERLLEVSEGGGHRAVDRGVLPPAR